ncbi:Adenylate isopentenyltransferase, partial [Linum perenne]
SRFCLNISIVGWLSWWKLGWWRSLQSSSHQSWVNKAGLVEAICVPEFEHYFELVKNGNCSDAERKMVYEEAVREVKENTCHLAERQIEKITQFKRCGWNLHRIDATEAVKVSMESPLLGDEVWEREVVQPSANIVKQFLDK